MGLYGDANVRGFTKRAAVGDDNVVFTARFTSAGGSNPTVDNVKTRGAITVARTGTGTITITLPYKLRNSDVQCTVSAYPAGAISHVPTAQHVEGTKVVTIVFVTLAGNVAADTTGHVVNVRVEGRVI